MNKPTTRDMSDAHEAHVAEIFEGYVNRGSGNQFNRQTDGRMGDRYQVPFAFAFDGKSTFGDSIGVSKKMWEKVVEQAGAERPMLPLRFYTTYRLDVGLDLAVVDLNDLAELVGHANTSKQRIADAVESHFLECRQMTPACLADVIEKA